MLAFRTEKRAIGQIQIAFLAMIRGTTDLVGPDS